MLTSSEVLVSVTGLEFSYTQAPRRMKSVVMALYLLAVALGNALTALVNHAIRNADGSSSWSGVGYYRFFVGLMLATAVLFVPFARVYKERAVVQGAGEADEADAASHAAAAAHSPARATTVSVTHTLEMGERT